MGESQNNDSITSRQMITILHWGSIGSQKPNARSQITICYLVPLGLIGDGSQPVVLAEEDGGNAPEGKASFLIFLNKSPIVTFDNAYCFPGSFRVLQHLQSPSEEVGYPILIFLQAPLRCSITHSTQRYQIHCFVVVPKIILSTLLKKLSHNTGLLF